MAEAVGIPAPATAAAALSAATPEVPLDPAAEIAALRARLAEREAVIADLTRQLAVVERQGQQITALEQQLAWLQAQFQLAQHRRFGASSEQTDAQLRLFNEAEQAAADAPAATDATTTAPAAAPAPRPHARVTLSPGLPYRDVTHDVPADQRVCPHDGTPLVAIGSEDSAELRYVPAHLEVVRHHRRTYACPKCHQHVVTAERPRRPIPKSVASPSLLAAIATQKYADGLPLYRQVTQFARLGVTLDRTTLARWMVQAGELVQPLLNLLGDQWAAQPVVHMDETPVQVLREPGKPAQSESWMWVRASAGAQPVRLFHYALTRARTVPLELLSADTQVLMVDGYSGYAEACSRYGIQRLACWAHARRKFVDAQRLQPKGKTGKPDQAIAFIAKLYQIERASRDGPPAVRYARRQQEAKPVLDQLHAWLEKALPTTPPKSVLGQALAYLHHQWPSLVRYLEDGRYPIDNQLAENAIRPFATGRSLCTSFSGN